MKQALDAGLALLRNGQYRSAEKLLLQAAQASGGARAWHLLGVARHALGNRDGAIEALRQALKVSPRAPDPVCALATILGETGAWQAAEEALRDALQGFPDHAQLNFNLAFVLERRGAVEEALQRYEAALASDSGHAQARLNAGALRMRLGRHGEALEAFEALVARNPDFVEARINQNRALLLLHRDEEALEAAEAALRLVPGRPDALLGKASALASMGRLEEASEALGRCGARWTATGLYVGRALERQGHCDWRDRDRLVSTIRALLERPHEAPEFAEPALVYRSYAMPFSGPELRRIADLTAARFQAPEGAAAGSSGKRSGGAPGKGRIRVGILSSGVSIHPDYLLLRAVLKRLDRRSFDVRLYALNGDDGGAQRRELAGAADAFRDFSSTPSGELVRRIREEALDVLLDTGAYFNGGRPEALKARVAPVQAAYLSVPGPYGEGLVDYRISDPAATPAEVQEAWSEKLVLLPGPHFIYDNPAAPSDRGDRVAHGLPRHGPVLACFNQNWKIEPEVFKSWMQILTALPDAVLWLLESGPRSRENLRSAARAAHVDPDRIVFSARVDLDAHIARLASADLALDCFHYNSITTALDALWAGLPLVTRTGQTMASRLAGSFVRAAGLGELVVDSTEAYEAIVLELARNPSRLAHYRRVLQAARTRSRLFDLDARVRDLERGLTAMVERHRAGLPPATIDLS